MRRLLVATFLVSAAAIGYEILLMRVLSIVQWHHFAYMIISLALLGYGASGSFIAIFRKRLEERFEPAFSIGALLFSVTLVASYMVGQRIPFNALEIVWDSRQLLLLSLLYFVYFVPFFFAACCIGLALTCRRSAIGRIYFSDLFGAGTGAMLVIAALFVLSIDRAIVLLASIALASSIALTRRSLVVAQIAWAASLFLVLPQSWFSLQVSPYKGLAQALEVIDSEVVTTASGPLGLLTVVDSPTVPFRHAPGLSFNARDVPPEQLGVFTDADGLSAITRYDGEMSKLGFLADLTATLPYQLLDRPEVLILGGGAGGDALLALYHDARHVDVVELNPQMTRLITETHADFAGEIYADPRVTVHANEARGYIARSERLYDLVYMGLLDSFGASGAGVHSLNESYIYTVEALQDYLAHTRPGGFIAITRWIKLPPRDSLKLFATAIAALRRSGVANPGERLALVRSWNTSLLLIKNGAIAENEVSAIREFARSRSFDIAYVPGIAPDDANRFNRLDQPHLYLGAEALLGDEADAYMDRYKFDIAPATDDKPYYFHFFKWRTLPEVLALRSQGGAGLIEWGYLVLVATLAQAVLAGVLVILLPLSRAKRSWSISSGLRFGGYFLLLGFAFLFIEMACIQKFILFLSHPLYSVAVVLSSFLVFAGLGSAASAVADRVVRRPVLTAVTVIGVLALAYLVLLPLIFERFMGSPDAVRISLSALIIAPLAFCMGMPFPLGLSRVSDSAPDFVPWAWGINGFASVVSAVLATVLAIEYGFSAVVVVAVACYVLAAVLSRSWR
jgi:hypothetical protein